MPSIYTVGHGARSLDEFLHLLTETQIQTLVDVRRYPGSRRHPHFAREALGRSLKGIGVGYEWWGETLGGRREPNPESKHEGLRNASFRAYGDHMESKVFAGALDELASKAVSERVAIMCAETLWWKCHRRLIADALVARQHEVIHIGAGADKTHEMTAGARYENGVLIYNAPTPDLRNEKLF